MRDGLYSYTTFEFSKLVEFSPKHDSRFEKLKQELGYVHTGTISYLSDFWNGKVDCSLLSYQFWDLFTRVRYRTVP